jgi:hypothetical protein
MIPTRLGLSAVLVSLCGLSAACASPDRFAGLSAERGVFASPYVAPEISQQGIGPEPEGVDPRRRPYLDSLTYLGRGRAVDTNGRVIRLSRDDRRLLRERSERLRQRAEELERAGRGASASPPPPLALPGSKP